MKRHRTCGAFWQRPVRRVALVGNGPLTERQRVSANTADLVIRINKMNNRSARSTSAATADAHIVQLNHRLPSLAAGSHRFRSQLGSGPRQIRTRMVQEATANTSAVDARQRAVSISCQQHTMEACQEMHTKTSMEPNAAHRFCGERVDVWLLRHAAEDAHLRWHGLGELAHCATSEVLEMNPVLWLFGGARPGNIIKSNVYLCKKGKTKLWLRVM